MHRRTLLQLLTAAGAGTLATGLRLWTDDAAPTALVLVTDRPGRDRDRLLRLAGLDAEPRLRVEPVPETPQDLTLLRRGVLVDPHRAVSVPAALAAFAGEVRARRTPGRALLSLVPPAGPEEVVTIRRDGVVVERVPVDRTYDHIDIDGPLGRTVFRFRDGRLRVHEASCRHAICKKMSTHTTGRIICVPNRLVATLPHRPTGAVDAVTG